MQQESKQNVDETTVDPAQDQELNEEESMVEENDSKQQDSSDEPEIDYKAELEKLQHTNELYKRDLKALKSKTKELKQKLYTQDEVEDSFDDEDDEPNNELSLLREEIQTLKSELSSNVVEDVLSSITNNSSEQDLIRYHYNNTIKQTGLSKSAIQQDLHRARLIANERLLMREKEELQEALKAKATLGTSHRGATNKKQEMPIPKLNDLELAILKRRNIDPRKVKFDIK